MPSIRTCIIPAAGLGTRFLPFTKAVPKELLPILNKPALEYILEECQQSGIEHMVMITSRGKDALMDYCDRAPLIEQAVARTSKADNLSSINTLISEMTFAWIRQEYAGGLGHAILTGKPSVSDEYFAVVLPDDIMVGDDPALGHIMNIALKYNASVILVHEVDEQAVSSYGIINPAEELASGIIRVASLLEKPKPADAPSRLAISGRYILHREIFDILGNGTQALNHGELQLTDAIQTLIDRGHTVIAATCNNIRYDIGQPKGWLQANIAFGKKAGLL